MMETCWCQGHKIFLLVRRHWSPYDVNKRHPRVWFRPKNSTDRFGRPMGQLYGGHCHVEEQQKEASYERQMRDVLPMDSIFEVFITRSSRTHFSLR